MSKHRADMQKIYEKNRAFDTAKQKSYYPHDAARPTPWIASDAYKENFDRIFRKRAPSNVTEEVTNE